MKPEMRYEDGKLIVKAGTGLDSDHDGKNSVSANVEVVVDAMEAVSEITKDSVPQWLLDLIEKKA